ncbi:lysophospholipid acyltransferase family protein [Silanimonas sp.]|uniref:lysophospholipid acyltransferase family protein n=1 Tax=Silanimonas sp. TaxID=1929290 RepID=UPI0037C6A07C
MIQLEQRLVERYPHWFEGPKAVLAQGLARSIAKFGKLDDINAWLAANGHRTGFDFVEGVLDHFGTRYTVDQVERGRIPQTGRVIIVANHPLGALDSLALLHLVGGVRRDVRILANDFLMEFEGLRELLLPLRILGGKPSAESLKAVTAALEAEQAVIVFPAGEVARFGWRGVQDGRWRAGFVKFARESGAPVLPVRIKAKNSALFYGLSSLYKPVGTALLPREIFKARGLRIDLRIGLPRHIDAEAIEGGSLDTAKALASMRQALQAIGTRKETAPPGPMPLAHAVDRGALRAEILAMRELGRTPDGKQIRVGRLRADSLLLRELGRLREQSFRAVGEGTGRAIDVDAYDTWYEHIVLWDADALQIAGAYRVCRGADVLATRGLKGLYTASLFDFGPEAQAHVAQGMELGRSFVAPAYWGSRSLDYLWIGIGAYLRAHPDVRYLFGPVSISAELPIAAREQLVAYYGQHYGAPGVLALGEAAPPARARRPFQFLADAPCYRGLDAEQSFRVLRANLDALGAKVPVLYKQYTELCEPGGARFLAFGVDPDFANCVDGLIEVDLQRIKPKKFQRYIAGEITA